VWTGCSWDGSKLTCGGAAQPAAPPAGFAAQVQAALQRMATAAQAQFCLYPDIYGAAAGVSVCSALGLELGAVECASAGVTAGQILASNICAGGS